MTDLAETALEFCKSCLGWEDAKVKTGADTVYQGHGGGRLNPHDLNSVERAVAQWCIKVQANYDFSVVFNAKTRSDKKYTVYIERLAKDGTTPESKDRWKHWGMAMQPDLGHALLAACLEAQRKLKSV